MFIAAFQHRLSVVVHHLGLTPRRFSEKLSTAPIRPGRQGGPVPLVIHKVRKTRASIEMPLSLSCVYKRLATTVKAVPGSVSIKTGSELLMIVAVK
jgi:hypothetical protein